MPLISLAVTAWATVLRGLEKAGKARNKPKIKGLYLPLIRTAFDAIIETERQ
jgi:hypothetical protein